MIDDRLVQELAGTIEVAPVEELHAIIGQLEELKSMTSVRLYFATIRSANNGAGEKDELLTVKQASERLGGISENYLYQNSKKLPFTVRIGSRVLFSSRGIEEFIRHNQG